MSYTRILKAKFSPANKCFVEDGEVLSIVPRAKVPIKQFVSHHFVSARDLTTKSKFGWVEEAPPFTLKEFLERFHAGSSDPELWEHVKRMLDAAAKVSVGAALAADYAARGLPPSRMELSVHRVIFHS